MNNDIENYNSLMQTYRKAEALKDYDAAEKAVRSAIGICPVPEALPVLAEMHHAVSLKAEPSLLMQLAFKVGLAS